MLSTFTGLTIQDLVSAHLDDSDNLLKVFQDISRLTGETLLNAYDLSFCADRFTNTNSNTLTNFVAVNYRNLHQLLQQRALTTEDFHNQAFCYWKEMGGISKLFEQQSRANHEFNSYGLPGKPRQFFFNWDQNTTRSFFSEQRDATLIKRANHITQLLCDYCYTIAVLYTQNKLAAGEYDKAGLSEFNHAVEAFIHYLYAADYFNVSDNEHKQTAFSKAMGAFQHDIGRLLNEDRVLGHKNHAELAATLLQLQGPVVQSVGQLHTHAKLAIRRSSDTYQRSLTPESSYSSTIQANSQRPSQLILQLDNLETQLKTINYHPSHPFNVVSDLLMDALIQRLFMDDAAKVGRQSHNGNDLCLSLPQVAQLVSLSIKNYITQLQKTQDWMKLLANLENGGKHFFQVLHENNTVQYLQKNHQPVINDIINRYCSAPVLRARL